MYEPGHTPSGPHAALDPERLAAVFGDDREGIHEVLVMAIDSLRALIASVRTSLERGELVSAKAAAHEIKGVSGNVGALALASAALALEQQLSSSTTRPAAELVAPLADAYDRFAAEARAILDRSS
jgi:HPt (histidine-containing phosphotransfer) domain-containing protein